MKWQIEVNGVPLQETDHPLRFEFPRFVHRDARVTPCDGPVLVLVCEQDGVPFLDLQENRPKERQVELTMTE